MKIKKQNKQNLKIRYNIITTGVYFVGIILFLQLFNLQIIHGTEYRETSNTRLSRESTLKAARGNICDNTGAVIVGTTTSNRIELYKSKIENDILNKTLLDITNVLESNKDTYIDELPIAINPFRFTYQNQEKEEKWKKANRLDEKLSAEEVFYKLKEKYKIKNDNIEETRKIMAIRYHIAQEGYSSTKSVIIAENISNESCFIFYEQNDRFPGVNIVLDAVRSYPKGTIASHIVGYTSKITSNQYKQEKENRICNQ